jgi:LysM repeat protein
VLKGPDSKDAKAYVVQTGDTMFAIAKRFSVTAAALAEENDLSTGSAIKKGQKLRLPDGYKDKGPTKTTVMQAQAGSSSTAGPAPRRRARRARPNLPPIATPAGLDRSSTFGSSGRTVTTTSVSVTGSVVEVAGPRRSLHGQVGRRPRPDRQALRHHRADLAEDNDLEAANPSPGRRS